MGRACIFGCSIVTFRGRELRPAAHSLSFASPKESKQRKGDPAGCVPALRFGQPVVLGCGVRRGTRFALRAALKQPRRVSSRSRCVLRHTCPPRTLRSSAHPEGPPTQPSGPSLRSAKGARRNALAHNGPSEAMARVGCLTAGFPSGCAEERSGWRKKGRALSERNAVKRVCADPASREHRRLPRSAAQGTRTVGSPFFWVRFFGEAKKSTSAAGPRPGPGTQNKSHYKNNSNRTNKT
ncbi:hypothetical protein SAMN05192589_102505 [Paracidovorax valerianellae]|uniref:Uncharacterized protein n=1 Tax=Paracidovorax valerianellae TaxID=187868 RepID=A0A1G6MT58_9BURK|nr:hypothetical protein SAMN05192589_102505 [Paracidovorax valerianellae]